jgi:hypothetical protein
MKNASMDIDDALKRLDSYILVMKNISMTMEAAASPPPNTITEELLDVFVEKTKSDQEWFQPKQHDTLFWCIFIAHHGQVEYQQIDRNYGVREMEKKKEIGEYISLHSDEFKKSNKKITKVAIQEMRSEFLTSSKETSMNCLLAMCVYYKINILLLEESGKFYLEYCAYTNTEDTLPYYVLKRDTFKKYSICTQPFHDNRALQEWKKGKIEIVNPLKPVKSIGAFRVEELEDFARIVGVYDETKKMKKADIYKAIVDMVKWY